MLPVQHIISAAQLTPEVIEAVADRADSMERIVIEKGRTNLLNDTVTALLFYEPSSRTMLSFEAAVQRLGGGMIFAQGKEMSSLKKGESIEDTIRMVMGYADLIVMRHQESGSAERAANVCSMCAGKSRVVPFINAGDGWNEHPTQAMLDAYTIRRECGTLSGLHIAFAADPLHSRTIRSLALVLSQYKGNRFTFISPDRLRISDDLRTVLDERCIPFEETTDLSAGIDADILYMNRLQEERFSNHAEFEAHRADAILTADMVRGKDVLIMDPLPRVDEIDTAVDDLPNALYWKQAGYGVPVRMALLTMMLGKG